MTPSTSPSGLSPRLVRTAVLLTGFTLALLALIGATPRRADAAVARPKLSVTATKATAVSVSWSTVKKAAGYTVKFSRSKKMTKPTYVKTTKASAELRGLDAATTYYVKVRATKKSGKKLSGYSAAIKVRTRATTVPASGGGDDLRVGSYNVTCDKCFDGQPNELHWADRKDAVAASINAQDLDVVGVQEAGQGWLKNSAGKKIDLSQFEDLQNALGGHWELTNAQRNNCARSKSPNKCDYVDQGASDGTRIFYDASRISVLDSGSKLLPTVKGVNDRYVAWAQLQQRSTGKQFMFATTQLEHTKDKGGSTTMWDLRRDQAKTIVSTVARHNPGDLPVIVVGDLNSSRFDKSYSHANAPYDVFLKAGFTDPLGGAWKTHRSVHPTAEKVIRGWMDSFNGYSRTDVGHPDWEIGSYIDYILVNPSLRVKEWETVAALDGNGHLTGIIPSDHNMIRATVVL